MDTHTENIKVALKRVIEVASITDATIKDGIIQRISIKTVSSGNLTIERLAITDAKALFDFYFSGLSEQSRNFWPPYPLFSPRVDSAEELALRIMNWQKEDDWTVLKLVKDDRIIGIGLLKRYKTERPTSGLAVREEFHGKGLGSIIQTIIIEQARLLKLDYVQVTVAPDNTASLELHKRCGFERTGKMVPHYGYINGNQVIDRHDVELILKLNHE